MDTTTASSGALNARSLLLPYLLALLAAMALVQAVIALTGGGIGVAGGALTAAVAAGTAAWIWRNYRRLTRIRFGLAIAHVIAFLAVTASFNLHAVIRLFALGSDGTEAQAAQELLATPWFGATLLMSAVWGTGVLIHLAGSVLGRGWED